MKRIIRPAVVLISQFIRQVSGRTMRPHDFAMNDFAFIRAAPGPADTGKIIDGKIMGTFFLKTTGRVAEVSIHLSRLACCCCSSCWTMISSSRLVNGWKM